MGCACSKAVAAATQEDIDRLTGKQPRRKEHSSKRQYSPSRHSEKISTATETDVAPVHEVRVTPPASVSSGTSPKKKLIRRSDGADSTQEMHREASVRSGSDRSAPSTCQSIAQRSSGQGRRHRKRSYAGSAASAGGATEFTQDGASTFMTGEDDSSDWDRFSDDGNETTSSTALSDGSGPASQGGQDNAIRRPREHSLFGVAEKRAPAPFRETTSLNLAKLRGVTFVNQYVVIKYLGKGANGRVFLCLDMCDNRLYAVKIVKKVDMESARGRKKRNPLNDLRREVAIMRTLRHKNIVALQEVVDDPGGNKMLLVMDYMEGGPVLTREGLERGRRIPEPLALQYFRDMCKALDYLHFNKVVHGDLKPENVLMSARGQVTLSDFGCSKVLGSGNEYLEKCQGTPAFLAPEMMRPHSRYRGRPTDIYALGACLFTFVYGRIPFSAPTVYQLFQVVQTESLKFPEEPAVSDDLKDLLYQMLIKNPRERITLSRVMRHPWVTKRSAWPLLTVREMGGCTEAADDDMNDINPQLVQLPDLMATSNVLDIPRQDHLLEVLKPGLAERAFSDGEYLIRQGDQGTHLLYILEGSAEVFLKLSNPRIAEHRRASSGYGGSRDSDGLQQASQVPEVIGDELPPTLLEGASRARTVITGLQRGHREFLVAVRREGQFVGEMAAFASAALRCASVRARGPVRAKIVPGELLRACVERVPEARQQLKEMVWMKSSENMVLEAMFRLSGLHDALEELLRAPALPPGPTREEKGKAVMHPQHTAIMVEPDEVSSSTPCSSSASAAHSHHSRSVRPPAGHSAVYRSPTPSVPVLRVAPVVQPASQRRAHSDAGDAPKKGPSAAAPGTQRGDGATSQARTEPAPPKLKRVAPAEQPCSAQSSPDPEALPAPSAAFMGMMGAAAAKSKGERPGLGETQDASALICKAPQDNAPLHSMERQGSCPVNGSSPISVSSGPMSARSHLTVGGLPQEQSSVQAAAAPEDAPAAKGGITGVLATPRDSAQAGDTALSKNPSIFGPLRTMGNPLPSLETSSFDGRAQARSGLFRTEGPASMARKLAHHPEPLRSSFMATMRKPTQTRSAQAESAEAEAVPQDGRARSEGSAPEQATDSGSAADTQPPSETPVQTRFSITEAVPLPHVVHTDESAPVTAEE
ncbi:hypothetical protein CVIRNUC_006332 [Coccomyxa viridis]|uniref:cGMP-dependent protein kinase n=1 Tax=Coccomyxa viridis TaxID=1274662 RepID=A0AAV1I700_9CHLO|nr:hypothetical protein CVIRNUC_006332 [Coccomyxa viridis]